MKIKLMNFNSWSWRKNAICIAILVIALALWSPLSHLALRLRLSEKMAQVKEGMTSWKVSGRDPSVIAQEMMENFRPLMEAGKVTEAEAVLDGILHQIKRPVILPTFEGSFSEFSSDKPLTTVGNLGLQLIFNSTDSPVGRIESKLPLIKKLSPDWIKNGGDAAKLQALLQEVSTAGDKQDFVGADAKVDEVLNLLGASDTSTVNASADAHRKERDGYLDDAKKFNLSGIEDYIGWCVVEPEQGKLNWDMYREDAVTIKRAGYKFVPFLWPQVLPKWIKADPKYVFSGNVLTGRETEDLSIFAPETLDAYDHFYGEAAHELEGLVDLVRIGSPYDYGETSYPAGAASAQFPKKNLEPGFWVNEAPARAHFRETMRKKYGTVEQLNAAWGTSFTSFETIDYPKDTKSPRYWLDFIHWYQDGFTEMMGKIVVVAQKHFSPIPISFNIGWPYEKVNLGQDISGLVKMAAEKGIYLRTPTGPMVPFLFTKRVATAVRHYKPAGFSSEPVDASAPYEQMALTYFKDLTTGVKWHFDYGGNYERNQESFFEYRKQWTNAEYPQIQTALFFPTTAHFLEDWDNWRGEGFSGGFPDGLQEYAEGLRSKMDYDVVDERLISDGFLDAYQFLIWPKGKIAENETMEKVQTWVKNGGTLLISGLGMIKTVEGTDGGFEALANIPAIDGVRQFGKGKIIEIGETVADLEGRFPAQLNAQDGVLVSDFNEGTLLFNKTDQPVQKKLPGNSAKITLAPFQIQWVSH